MDSPNASSFNVSEITDITIPLDVMQQSRAATEILQKELQRKEYFCNLAFKYSRYYRIWFFRQFLPEPPAIIEEIINAE
jgi:hypothetical protein